MKNRTAALVSAGLGAGLMYLLDPDRGRRRRAMLRDQAVHAAHKSAAAADATREDVRNRVRGMVASTRSWFSREAVPDDVLEKRVRSAIGRVVSHPGAISVHAVNGHVALSGPILAHEVHPLIARVYAVRGVTGVENNLEAHAEPGNIPSLQGAPSRRGIGRRLEFMQVNWSPAARLAAGVAGGALGLGGLSRRGVTGAAMGAAGVTLLARAVSNMELKRLVGLGAGRRAVDIQKTVHLDAPVDQVFALWADHENLPSFMSHVKEVRKLDDKRWRWTVTGPGDTPIEWDAVTTVYEPNQLLGWRTEPGALIQHSGVVRFQANPDGSTTLNLRMTYNPMFGAAGHAMAKMLGADPKKQLDDDLMRLKSFIEQGTTSRTAERPMGEF